MISNIEMRELSEQAQAGFRQELLSYLRRHLSKQTRGFDDATLMERIIENEQRALGYGMADNATIAWFTCMAFGFGQEFDLNPEVQSHLRSEELSAEEKLFELMDYFQSGDAAGTLHLSPEEVDEVVASAFAE